MASVGSSPGLPGLWRWWKSTSFLDHFPNEAHGFSTSMLVYPRATSKKKNIYTIKCNNDNDRVRIRTIT